MLKEELAATREKLAQTMLENDLLKILQPNFPFAAAIRVGTSTPSGSWLAPKGVPKNDRALTRDVLLPVQTRTGGAREREDVALRDVIEAVQAHKIRLKWSPCAFSKKGNVIPCVSPKQCATLVNWQLGCVLKYAAKTSFHMMSLPVLIA